MAFVIAGAARMTYSSVRAAIDAHHDVSHGVEPVERFDRWGDKKDMHPVYGFVRRAEEKWRDRKGKGKAAAEPESGAASIAPASGEGAQRTVTTSIKKDEPVAVNRVANRSEDRADDEELPGYDSRSAMPLGLPSPAYTQQEPSMPILPSVPVHDPENSKGATNACSPDTAQSGSERPERRLLAV